MDDIIEVIEFLLNKQELEDKGFKIIGGLLKILPSNIKKNFIQSDILQIWLVVPKIVRHILKSNGNCEAMNVLKLLTQEVQSIDYIHDYTWTTFMVENICRPEKYPADIKRLLREPNNIMWHQLWISLVKLLKNDVIMKTSKGVCAIDSLLPVVKLAFRLDNAQRCRAFECWTVLIDILPIEINDKKLKLLMTPLKASNASDEILLMAKFNTWWQLIHKFQTRMGEEYAKIIILPFLKFCFNMENVQANPSLISRDTKTIFVDAFVDIIGHVKCNNECVSLKKFTTKFVTTNVLVSHWQCWIDSLKAVIKLSHELDLTIQLTCAWKSFNLLIAKLSETDVRADLFNNMLVIISEFEMESRFKLYDTAIIIFNVLIYSLFEEPEIKKLLKTTDLDGPMYKIMYILFKCKLQYLPDSSNEIVRKLKIITTTILDSSPTNSNPIINWILNTMPASNNTLVLWKALTESIIHFKYKNGADLLTLIKWSLKYIYLYSKGKIYAELWYDLYKYSCPMLPYTNIKTMLQITDHYITSCPVVSTSSAYFIVYILKGLFEAVSNDEEFLNDGKFAKDIFIVLIEKLILILQYLRINMNITLANITSTTVITTYKMMTKLFETNSHFGMPIIKNLINSTARFLSVEMYSEIKVQIYQELDMHPKILRKLQTSIDCKKSKISNQLAIDMIDYPERLQRKRISTTRYSQRKSTPTKKKLEST